MWSHWLRWCDTPIFTSQGMTLCSIVIKKRLAPYQCGIPTTPWWNIRPFLITWGHLPTHPQWKTLLLTTLGCHQGLLLSIQVVGWREATLRAVPKGLPKGQAKTAEGFTKVDTATDPELRTMTFPTYSPQSGKGEKDAFWRPLHLVPDRSLSQAQTYLQHQSPCYFFPIWQKKWQW